MLTDEELQAIADEYVRSLPQWESHDIRAERSFTMHDPPGAYFTTNPRRFVQTNSHVATASDIAEARSNGIFIYRESGTVRQFKLRDLNTLGVECPDDIRHLLTGPVTPRRPWWKFW